MNRSLHAGVPVSGKCYCIITVNRSKRRRIKIRRIFDMKVKKFTKGLLVTSALALTIAAAPASLIRAEAAPAQQTADSSQEQAYVLDYNAIAPWVDGGFIGNDESGAPVVMALNQAGDYAIIIFGDNSDMTAVSFVGPITFSGEYATITDETNGMALTFSVTQSGEGNLTLDMGGIGQAVITAATKESVLETIRTAIENYRHIV